MCLAPRYISGMMARPCSPCRKIASLPARPCASRPAAPSSTRAAATAAVRRRLTPLVALMTGIARHGEVATAFKDAIRLLLVGRLQRDPRRVHELVRHRDPVAVVDRAVAHQHQVAGLDQGRGTVGHGHPFLFGITMAFMICLTEATGTSAARADAPAGTRRTLRSPATRNTIAPMNNPALTTKSHDPLRMRGYSTRSLPGPALAGGIPERPALLRQAVRDQLDRQVGPAAGRRDLATIGVPR